MALTVKRRLGREGGKQGSSAGQSEGEDIEVAVGKDMRELAWLVHAVHHLPASLSPLKAVALTMVMAAQLNCKKRKAKSEGA